MKRNPLFMEIYGKHLQAQTSKNAKQIMRQALEEWTRLCEENKGKKGFKPVV